MLPGVTCEQFKLCCPGRRNLHTDAWGTHRSRSNQRWTKMKETVIYEAIKIAWVILLLITAVSLVSSTWQHRTKLNPQLYSTHLKVATHANENSVKTGWSFTEKLCATGDWRVLIKNNNNKLWNIWHRLTMPKFLDLCQVKWCSLLTVTYIHISVGILRILQIIASLTGRYWNWCCKPNHYKLSLSASYHITTSAQHPQKHNWKKSYVKLHSVMSTTDSSSYCVR